jgi:molybdate transport system substrate-binding protein
VNVKRLVLAAAMAGLFPAGAQAAEITVLTSGVTAPVLRSFAEKWGAATGNKVTLKVGTVGGTVTNVTSVPADAVLLMPDVMSSLAVRLKPVSTVTLASTKFALAAKKGAPMPDISTVEKFATVLKNSTGLQFNDPATGSASGALVAAMLKRPEFQGVIARPIAKTPGVAVAEGDADLGGGALSEELPVAGAEVIGLFPDSLGLHLDFSGAVLANAADPDTAAAFLVYLKSTPAGEIWRSGGFVTS